MAEPIISFIPENDKAFALGLKRLGEATKDFRIPFGLIGRDFYRSNRIIFGLKSEGLYAPLGGFNPNQKVTYKGKQMTRKDVAEEKKKAEVGFVYPLLKRNGALEKSLSSKSGSGAEFFAGRQSLIMGTNVSYAKFHQSDKKPRTKLPQRKIIFISGGPAEQSRDSRIAGRRERWLNIMNEHVIQLTKDYK